MSFINSKQVIFDMEEFQREMLFMHEKLQNIFNRCEEIKRDALAMQAKIEKEVENG